MSESTNKYTSELDALIVEGRQLLRALEYDCHKDEMTNFYMKKFNNDKNKANEYIKSLPMFTENYQSWYSKALAVVKQILPDRVADFISYFDAPKGRREISFQNYMIRDYLQGLQITRVHNKEVVVDGGAAIPEFIQQLSIVKAARVALESKLMDLKAILQADLFDSEIEAAAALAKAGYLRAAGAICGVLLEKHLLHVCSTHKINLRKRNPTISELSQMLRDSEITTIPQWRFIQHLADIRNLCDHAKGREPTKDEIADLLSGSEKILKTIS